MKQWQKDAVRRALNAYRDGKALRVTFSTTVELDEGKLADPPYILASVRKNLRKQIAEKWRECERISNARTRSEYEGGNDEGK